ncbi:MAG TPA: ATP-dependent DNA ligase [Dermatophilaceae bacterium]|nr:ATP-dependent DNA ligase [Dermatophilaceae bacterium]
MSDPPGQAIRPTGPWLADVVEASAAVAATRSRSAKVAIIAEALRAATGPRHTGPDHVATVAAYLSGALPQRRLGVGWRSLGEPPPPAPVASLTVAEVDAVFDRVAGVCGSGAAGLRADLMLGLLARATVAEQRFLIALILGDIRQGALDGILLQAVARAADVPEKAVRRAVMLAGHAGPVARAALAGGQEALAQVRLEVGRPVRPMLAAAAPDLAAAWLILGAAERPVAVEGKLDGIRIQVHKQDAQVRIFTRSLDEVTDRLPEVVELAAALPARSVVLDGEALALDHTGRPLPFQVTSARIASSTSLARLRDPTLVTPFLFDVLHLDGRDLIDAPAAERVEVLADLVAPDFRIPRLVTADLAQAQRFAADLVARGHEGTVVKNLSVGYAAGRRGAGWVKVKPRHTLDLVVLAVEWGSGRRRGFLSNIHLGARDPHTGGFVMLGKTFKGMTDEMLAWQTARFLDLATGRDDLTVRVRPEQVVEVAIDGVQTSARYPAAMALRFARVVRYRPDKTAAEADTVATVRALHDVARGLPGPTTTPDQAGG